MSGNVGNDLGFPDPWTNTTCPTCGDFWCQCNAELLQNGVHMIDYPDPGYDFLDNYFTYKPNKNG